MTLPFTPDQFFDVLVAYNQALWPAVIVWWLASATLVAIVWRDPAKSGWLTMFLAALWLWNAIAYHAIFFTRINPAAWLFAAAFAAESIILIVAGRRQRFEYFAGEGVAAKAGVVLILYGLAYPFLTSMLGHEYPAAPTFGLPCPTDIMTIGMLMTLPGRITPIVGIVPILWAFIGGSAAILLAVPTDYALLAAGLMLPFAVGSTHAIEMKSSTTM